MGQHTEGGTEIPKKTVTQKHRRRDTYCAHRFGFGLVFKRNKPQGKTEFDNNCIADATNCDTVVAF